MVTATMVRACRYIPMLLYQDDQERKKIGRNNQLISSWKKLERMNALGSWPLLNNETFFLPKIKPFVLDKLCKASLNW